MAIHEISHSTGICQLSLQGQLVQGVSIQNCTTENCTTQSHISFYRTFFLVRINSNTNDNVSSTLQNWWQEGLQKNLCAFALLPMKSNILWLDGKYCCRCFHIGHSSYYSRWWYTSLRTWYEQCELSTQEIKERRYNMTNLKSLHLCKLFMVLGVSSNLNAASDMKRISDEKHEKYK